MVIICIKFIFILVLSYCLALVFRFQSADWIKDVAFPLLGTLSGVIIGSVGVFLGGLGSVFGFVSSLKGRMAVEDIDIYFDKLSKIVREIKENIVVALFAVGFCFVLYCFAQFDIPYLDWPFIVWWASKTVFINTMIFFCVVLCFYAIFDTINAVFEIHAQHAFLAKISRL